MKVVPLSIIAGDLEGQYLLILVIYRTFQGHIEGIYLANVSNKWYFV
jgi:hypothetical protein